METPVTVPTLAEAITEHLNYMRRVAYRLSKDFDLAADITQESFLAVLNQIHRYDPAKVSFKSFCANTTAWTARTILQARRRESAKLSDNAILGSVFASLPDRDTRKRVKFAWSQLSANHKRTLRSHFAGKLPSDQRMNLSRARKVLHQLLQSV